MAKKRSLNKFPATTLLFVSVGIVILIVSTMLLSSKISVTQNGENNKVNEAIKISNPQKTQFLAITNAELTSFPREIIKYKNIHTLFLYQNKLTNLPEEITELKHLRSIDLSNNEFTEFPLVLTKMPNLIVINIASNKISHIPQEIFALTNLESLNFNKNALTSLPPELTQLSKLRSLDIGSNQLTSLPESFDAITPTDEYFAPSHICPNPYAIEKMPIKFVLWTAYRHFYRTNPRPLEETAQAGEGITHLARRVVQKFLDSGARRGVLGINNTTQAKICLEDYLQNNIGHEQLQIGQKRTFNIDLITNAITSCKLIKAICAKSPYSDPLQTY